MKNIFEALMLIKPILVLILILIVTILPDAKPESNNK
jgi:hypothetical protein